MAAPTDDELKEAFLQAFTSPKKASNETGSVEAHSLADMIEFDKYIRGKTAADKPTRGVRFTKLIPPGIT